MTLIVFLFLSTSNSAPVGIWQQSKDNFTVQYLDQEKKLSVYTEYKTDGVTHVWRAPGVFGKTKIAKNGVIQKLQIINFDKKQRVMTFLNKPGSQRLFLASFLSEPKVKWLSINDNLSCNPNDDNNQSLEKIGSDLNCELTVGLTLPDVCGKKVAKLLCSNNFEKAKTCLSQKFAISDLDEKPLIDCKDGIDTASYEENTIFLPKPSFELFMHENLHRCDSSLSTGAHLGALGISETEKKVARLMACCVFGDLKSCPEKSNKELSIELVENLSKKDLSDSEFSFIKSLIRGLNDNNWPDEDLEKLKVFAANGDIRGLDSLCMPPNNLRCGRTITIQMPGGLELESADKLTATAKVFPVGGIGSETPSVSTPSATSLAMNTSPPAESASRSPAASPTPSAGSVETAASGGATAAAASGTAGYVSIPRAEFEAKQGKQVIPTPHEAMIATLGSGAPTMAGGSSDTNYSRTGILPSSQSGKVLTNFKSSLAAGLAAMGNSFPKLGDGEYEVDREAPGNSFRAVYTAPSVKDPLPRLAMFSPGREASDGWEYIQRDRREPSTDTVKTKSGE
jgi:hypothetical protein